MAATVGTRPPAMYCAGPGYATQRSSALSSAEAGSRRAAGRKHSRMRPRMSRSAPSPSGCGPVASGGLCVRSRRNGRPHEQRLGGRRGEPRGRPARPRRVGRPVSGRPDSGARAPAARPHQGIRGRFAGWRPATPGRGRPASRRARCRSGPRRRRAAAPAVRGSGRRYRWPNSVGWVTVARKKAVSSTPTTVTGPLTGLLTGQPRATTRAPTRAAPTRSIPGGPDPGGPGPRLALARSARASVSRNRRKNCPRCGGTGKVKYTCRPVAMVRVHQARCWW
jgi:hypothetical protein